MEKYSWNYIKNNYILKLIVDNIGKKGYLDDKL